jgi:pilus assembly protein CpaB
MKSKQLAVLGIALAAAVGAGYLALNLTAPQPVVVQQNAPAQPSVATQEVLVASAQITVGSKLAGNTRWQKWPEEALTDGLITRSTKPDAASELGDLVARNVIYDGEPIRTAKLLGPGEKYLSSMLPSGKRAVAVEISKDTSAGGFILPNDFVDIIMTRRVTENGQGGAASTTSGFVTETILKNIRVLAIDQTVVEDEKGEKTITGETATLELTPQQAEIVTVAQQMADRLSLALRSIADIKDTPGGDAEHLVYGRTSKGVIKLIKSGETSEVGAKQ